MLESKVSLLESLIQVTQTQVQAHAETQQHLVEAAQIVTRYEYHVAAIFTASKAGECAEEQESLMEMLT
ncbi:hypothetical protein EIP86_007093, partial [Pleurotus ostreatoroseus]